MAINIDDLLRRAVETRASDLHLKVGNHPYTARRRPSERASATSRASRRKKCSPWRSA